MCTETPGWDLSGETGQDSLIVEEVSMLEYVKSAVQ